MTIEVNSNVPVNPKLIHLDEKHTKTWLILPRCCPFTQYPRKIDHNMTGHTKLLNPFRSLP